MPSIFALASNSILCMVINGVVGIVNSLILNGKCAAIISRSVDDMRFLDCMLYLIAFDDNQEGQVFDTSAAVLFSLIQHSCIKIVFLVSNNRLKIAADLL